MPTPTLLIPSRLDQLLGSSQLAEAARLSVRTFEPWIADSTKGLFFFPEYTDHGPHHISAVLASAESLIRAEAWPHLTPHDAAILVLATLLHDSALHLMPDGLLDLLDSKRTAQRPLLTPLDTKSWPQLFDEFFADARRWDQRTLHRILGDRERRPEEEEDLYSSIRRLDEMPDPDEWSIRYRKFLGEFIRRHHGRLAHEIALQGVPGPEPDWLTLKEVPAPSADLAGLIARSHALHLRDTFPYLMKKYSHRATCMSCHPVFLMVLLRIADYLEIESGRANAALLKVQRLRSPISREEWDAHLAVQDIAADEQDAESISVHALPKTADDFLKLRRLLAGLQAELDTSWAVLGEVYSRQGDLAALGLTLRRVRTNLDDPQKFLADQEPVYFPVHASFDTAGADLLKLLIRPLYGDKPEVGVRELLQNALDAVHELHQYAKDHGNLEMRGISLPDHEADVLISIERDETGQNWVTVSDKGIGMTVETVRQYFLKAGASYRMSDAWRRSFELDGRSKVLRSGRFGIGALAAFLLGDRIQVASRHIEVKPSDGVRFDASIDDSAIELRRERQEVIGTTVRVRVSAAAASRLTPQLNGCWDWYVFDDPRVERRYHGIIVKQSYYVPAANDPGQFPADWRRIVPENYQAVDWSYSNAPALSCNGIRIPGAEAQFPEGDSQWVAVPKLSVIDRDGKLPLTLKRDSLEARELPFSPSLLRDVVSDLCAFFLIYSPSRIMANAFTPLRFVPLNPYSVTFSGLFFTSEGTAPLFPWNLRNCGLRRALLLYYPNTGIKFTLRDLPLPPAGAALIHARGVHPGTVGDARIASMLGASAFRWWRVVREPEPDDDWIRNFLEQLDEQATSLEVGELRWATRHRVSTSDLDQILAEILDQPIIPFDPEERLRKFPRAFDLLQDYVEVWRSPNLTGWRKDMVEALRDPLDPKN